MEFPLSDFIAARNERLPCILFQLTPDDLEMLRYTKIEGTVRIQEDRCFIRGEFYRGDELILYRPQREIENWQNIFPSQHRRISALSKILQNLAKNGKSMSDFIRSREEWAANSMATLHAESGDLRPLTRYEIAPTFYRVPTIVHGKLFTAIKFSNNAEIIFGVPLKT